tara:strand:- start:349 stop:2253 length:1905 start_codon:yes stop_codon:yes gene_type:complete
MDIRTKRNLFILLFLDIILIISSFTLSILLRFDFSLPVDVISMINLGNIFGVISIKLSFFVLFALYNGMWRYTSVWDMLNIIKANLSASFIIIIINSLLYGFSNIGKSVFLMDFIFCLGLIGVSRLGIRLFFSHIINALRTTDISKNKNNVILIGAGEAAHIILRQMQNKYFFERNKVIAIFDDNNRKIGQKLRGVLINGPIKKLPLLNLQFDQIYICAPSATNSQMRNIVEICKQTNKPFKTLPSLSELIEGKVSISRFREVSAIDLLGRKEIKLNKNAITKFIKGKRVMVTGAGGSIGSELVRQCVKFDPSLIILIEINELNLFKIEREFMLENSDILFKPILLDIREYKVLKSVFEEFKPQVLFHAAAYKHVPMQEKFPWEAVKTNIFGTNNLARLASNNNVEKFVLVSTDKAVRPTNVMGATKRIAEIIIQDYNYKTNTEFIAVRFGNVLGSSGSVIPIFKEQIKMGGPVTVTDPDMERYFMSIPEASQLILQAATLGSSGEIFILDMGSPVKILELAYDLIRLSGYEPDLDIPIKITGIRPGEKKSEELSLPSEKLNITKHEKILVLNDTLSTKNETIRVVKEISKLRDELEKVSALELKLKLSNILPDYKPEESPKKITNIKINKAEA